MTNHSFAVVAYGDSPYLSECLDSLKNQTIKSEIFISTSTPSPYLSDIANKFGVELFVTNPKHGIAHDWNFALQKAKSKYVTLAHQDDIYLPGYAEKCLQQTEKKPDTLICFTGYAEIVNGKERKSTSLLNVKKMLLGFFMPFKKNLRSKFFKRSLLSLGNPISAPGVMYNLELLKGFEFSGQFSINLDWYAWLEMSKIKGRFIYIPTILFKHRIHAGSETTAGLKTNNRQSEDLRMLKMFWPSWFANWLVKFYARSYKSNEIKQP
jgi:glycosyltransferase involved in cell wall biosynthesis